MIQTMRPSIAENYIPTIVGWYISISYHFVYVFLVVVEEEEDGLTSSSAAGGVLLDDN